MADDKETETKVEIGHVLAIDVVGYSKLLIDQQTRVMAELNRLVRGTVRFRVAHAAGRLIPLPTGDGMILVFFGDPEAAVECAMEVSAALKGQPDIALRMGIHSGPVDRVADVNEGANVTGPAIDLAQRVMDCGEAGHILLSRRVAYDLAPLPRWNEHLFELGECEVKGGQKISLANFYRDEIGNPAVPTRVRRSQEEAAARERKATRSRRHAMVTGLALLLLGTVVVTSAIHRRFTTIGPPVPAVSPPEKSIAVLPFVDLSQARDQEYFCDGISEELLDALAKTDRLRVVARTSSFSLKDKSVDASEIGSALNVSTILEGSLRRDGNRVRITAQLINARDGMQIWSETYERELQGVPALQDEITRAIVEVLKLKLAVAPAPRPPRDPEAYDLYLRGLYFSNKSTEPELRKSLDLFQQALEKDPTLERAWTGIARDWIWLADAGVRPLDAYPQAEAAARKALAIDEGDAEAHAYLGETRRIMAFDFAGEKTELQRALKIDPNSAVTHLFMAWLQSALEGPAAGLAQMQAAVQLDPLSPVMGSWQVAALVASGRFDEAFAATQRIMEIDPNYTHFEPNLALVYREQGKLQDALEIYLRLEQTRHQPAAGLAITYARLNRPEEARRVLQRMINLAETRYFPAEQVASVYVALGDADEAFHWIDRAIQEHPGAIHEIAYAREFRPLHSDPRFPDLLRRIGLDPAKFPATK